MRIIPVLDLKGGVVVRGVGGRRDDYRPIRSQLASDPSPASVAQAFHDAGFDEMYIADLDSLAGQTPDFASLQAIAPYQRRLWIDAGLKSASELQALRTFLQPFRVECRPILALESLDHPHAIGNILDTSDVENAVFSLDLKDGVPQSNTAAWRAMSIPEIVAAVVAQGIQTLILLDLSFVGESYGVGVIELCQQIRRTYSSLTLVSGGGVRSLDDVAALHQAGCDAVLVASALHDGRLTTNAVRSLLGTARTLP